MLFVIVVFPDHTYLLFLKSFPFLNAYINRHAHTKYLKRSNSIVL